MTIPRQVVDEEVMSFYPQVQEESPFNHSEAAFLHR
jgi:hypothetical protein